MQTFVITGGAGFIGSHMADRLLEMRYKVIAVDNFLTSTEQNIVHLKNNPHFQFLKHDVIQPLPADMQADFVFHLASPASPNHHSDISYHKLAMETMLVNTTGTLEVLKFAERNHARFLLASTSETYGDPLEHPQKETYNGNVSTTGPRSVYDEAKRFGETLTAYFHRDKQVDTRIARIFNTYGPRLSKADMRMSIIFINQALEGGPITIFGDGQQTRSLCYVSDTVEGLIQLMLKDAAKGEIVNIGSPEEHTVLEYATIVKNIINPAVEIAFTEKLPENDPKKRQPDISKAKQLLGWQPKVTLEEGLKKTIESFK